MCEVPVFFAPEDAGPRYDTHSSFYAPGTSWHRSNWTPC